MKKWEIYTDKFRESITIKEQSGAKTPIAIIATPSSPHWMENKLWYENAMKKAVLVSLAPEMQGFIKEVAKIGEGHAPSVGCATDIVRKANKILKKLE